jgi:chemotaxis protein CheD
MNDLKKFIVFPGQFVITTVPALISTVLGSCVSVCLWDREKKIGAMNHYLLPGITDNDTDSNNRGLTANRLLIGSMITRNSRIGDLEAKIFGGCNSLYKKNDIYKVGERNAAVAFEVLNDYGIRISAYHVGGDRGRKIVFNTSTGKVRMRLLMKTENQIDEEIHKGFGY